MPGYIDNSTDQALYESYTQGRAGVVSNTKVSHLAQWSAVNDSSTCDFCGWADERIFPHQEVPWDAPAHWGCRCIIAYILNDEFYTAPDWGEGPPKSSFPPGSKNGLADGKPTLRNAGKTAKPKAPVQERAAAVAKEWLARHGKKTNWDEGFASSITKDFHETAMRQILGDEFDWDMFQEVNNFLSSWVGSTPKAAKDFAGIMTRGSLEEIRANTYWPSLRYASDEHLQALIAHWEAQGHLSVEISRLSPLVKDGKITLYRGVKSPSWAQSDHFVTRTFDALASGDKDFSIGVGFFDSWSSSQEVAASFSRPSPRAKSIIFKKEVDVDEIWAAWYQHPNFRAFQTEREILWKNWDETLVPKVVDQLNDRQMIVEVW